MTSEISKLSRQIVISSAILYELNRELDQEHWLFRKLLKSSLKVYELLIGSLTICSRKKFVRRISLIQQKLTQTRIRLTLIQETGYIRKDDLQPLIRHINRLYRLLGEVLLLHKNVSHKHNAEAIGYNA